MSRRAFGHEPSVLSRKEWAELANLRIVKESWGLKGPNAVQDLATQAYAAKFRFVSGSPGYVGDFYVLQGDALTGDPPLTFKRREDGRLERIESIY